MFSCPFFFFNSLFLSWRKVFLLSAKDYEVRYRDVKYLKSDEKDKALNKLIFKDSLKELWLLNLRMSLKMIETKQACNNLYTYAGE